MSTKPTVFLVHGAWHQPDCFEQLKAQLTPHYTVHVPLRPSVGAGAPTKHFDDDVRHLQALFAEAADRGEQVFVVAHSAAGFVAPPAIEGLAWETRSRAGKRGGVIGLGLIAAFFGTKDHTIGTDNMLFEGAHVDLSRLEWVGPKMAMPHEPAQKFYNDLPDATAQYWVDKLVPSHIGTPQTLKHEGWRDVPAFFLVCENDKSMAPGLQKTLIEKAREHGANMRDEAFNSGHSPFLSMPEATAQWVERSIREAQKQLGLGN